MTRPAALLAMIALLACAACKREAPTPAKAEPPPAVLTASPGPETEGGHRVRSLASGPSQICALYASGAVACWGEGARPSLGLTGSADVPVRVPDVRAATQIALGACHGCALGKDGRVACWGYRPRAPDGAGAEGASLAIFGAPPCDEGAPVFAAHPVAVPDVPRIRLLATRGDGDWTSGLGEDERVYSWVPFAQPGAKTRMVGMPDKRSPDVTGAVELSAGATTCARMPDGKATCQRPAGGDGQALAAPTAPIVAIAETHLDDERCFLLATGAIECRSARATVAIPDERAAKAIAVAIPEVCALHADGTVACWAYDAAPPGKATPLPRSVEGARALASSRDQLCALVGDAAICWHPKDGQPARIPLP